MKYAVALLSVAHRYAVSKCRRLTILSWALCFFATCHSSFAATLNVAANDARLQYRGRVNFTNPTAPIFYWAGSEVTIAFRGTALSANLVSSTTGYLSVIVDDGAPSIITVSSSSASYTLAGGLPDSAHTLRLVRNNDYQVSSHTFNGFVITGDAPAILTLPAKPTRRIEFYGDSVTTGMGVLNPGDDQSMVNEDNYYAHGAITARTFGADYTCISRSGIGIVQSWSGPTMPQIYNRLDPSNPNSAWDFSSWIPDVVVVNLGQNDYWLITSPDQTTMVNAYKSFFGALRQKYPNALIIGAVGCMDAASSGSPFPGYISSAVTALNDPKIVSYTFAYTATAAHPSMAQQQRMADELAPIISQRMGWPMNTTIIKDNTDASGITFTGTWTSSTATAGYCGSNYRHDGNAGKGTKSVRFTPNLPSAGVYEISARWTSGTNRASNVPIDIVADAVYPVQVNQQINGGAWISLGTYNFNAGAGGSVLISNAGTSGFVIADAVRFVQQSAPDAAFETYNPPDGSSGDPHTLITDANASGGSLTQFDANAANDWVAYAHAASLTTGTYTIYLGIKKYPARGDFQTAVGLSGSGTWTNVGGAISQYASSAQYVEVNVGTYVVSTTGTYKVRFTCTGKNAASTSYRGVFDYVRWHKN